MKLNALLLIALALPFVMAGFATAQTGDDQTTKTPPAETKSAPETKAPADAKGTVEAKVSPKAGANPVVVLETGYGNIRIELFKDKAPISTDNFLSYVKEGYFDSTTFHRVVKNFVLQAGGITEAMSQKPAKPGIKNEALNGLSNLRGTLSMARTNDIGSGSSHFFINLVDNKRLDHTGETPDKYGYAVFGKVIEGMDVVDKIAQVEVTTKGGYRDVPVKPVIITKARLATAGPAKAVEKKAEEKQIEEKQTEEKKIQETQMGEPETGKQTK